MAKYSIHNFHFRLAHPQEDVFKIEAMDIGKVSKVKIRHDNSGIKSSWFLDKLVVIETKVGFFSLLRNGFF